MNLEEMKASNNNASGQKQATQADKFVNGM
jgi:hypothetical protein